MAIELPYLPDIIKEVVDAVSLKTQAFTTTPFSVSFKYGLMSQVGKELSKDGIDITEPLFWLIMNYEEARGKNANLYADVTCDVLILMPTEAEYSMDQRKANTYNKLIPAYSQFIEEICNNSSIADYLPDSVIHKRVDRPYWGGGDVNGANTNNLFKKNVDAIHIMGLKLGIKHKKQNC